MSHPSPRGPRTLIVTGLVLWMTAVASPAFAAPPTPVNRYHLAPSWGHNYTYWTFENIARMSPRDLGNFEPLRADPFLAGQFLERAESIYSDLRPEVFTSATLDGLPPNDPTSRRTMAWDLGFDKALPGYQALGRANAADFDTTNPLVRPHLVKAGVRPEYFEMAYRAGGGTTLSTLAAELAVAAEILRSWVDEVTEAFQGEEDIRADVLARFESATLGTSLPREDLEYFADILRGELSRQRTGSLNRYDQRELPVALRIARVAAAYRMTHDGAPAAACLGDGSVNITRAAMDPTDDTRAMCFTDATDRAVYAWYAAERVRQLAVRSRACTGSPLPCTNLAETFGPIRPAWAGAFDATPLRQATRAEVLEMQMAQTAHPDEISDVTYLRLLQRLYMAVYP